MDLHNDRFPPVWTGRPLRTVLIGTSLGRESDEVVSAGLELARAAGARVFLVHAAQLETPLVPLEAAAGLNLEQVQVAAREEELRRQVQRFITDELELLGTQVRAGAPHLVILRTARRIGADLIVVGATGAGPFAAALLGSTAERVARKAPCPVLVVRNGLRVPPRRVLAPVDLSTLSGDAFLCGLHLVAQLARGAEIRVRAVYTLGVPHALSTRQRTGGLALEQVERLADGELRRFVLESRPGAPFDVETAVLPGEARTEILRDLDGHPADLVILGTLGRSGIDRLVQGSVASAVCRKAPCSVLVISPEAALKSGHLEAITSPKVPDRQLERHGGGRARRTG